MIDNRGVPRVRCACGNPLLPPQAVSTTPALTGTRWPGFDPGNVTVVNPSPTPISIVTVINVTTGTAYGQPTGGNQAPVPLPAQSTTTTVPDPATSTTLPGFTPSSPLTTPTTAAPTTTTTAPTTTTTRCPGAPGELLERVSVDSANGTEHASKTYPAECGYRVVFSGDTDWNTNNSFQGGFDTHYCSDPQYCPSPQLHKEGGGLIVNGDYPWIRFGTAPPAYSQSHTYSYSAASLPSNRISAHAQDIAYSDNRGLFTIEIYRQ
jgi:hypothetical protein